MASCRQPVAASHESSVQTFWSSQTAVGPPRHTPPRHVSAVVQRLASSQPVPSARGSFRQPNVGSQLSDVHTLLYSHVACAGIRQRGSHASLSPVLLTSHCSGKWTSPLPH